MVWQIGGLAAVLGLWTAVETTSDSGRVPQIEIVGAEEIGSNAEFSTWAVEAAVTPGSTHDYASVRAELRVDEDLLPIACEAYGDTVCTFDLDLAAGSHSMQAVLTLLEDGEPTAGFVSPELTIVVGDAEPASEGSRGCSVSGRRFAGASWIMALLWLGLARGRRRAWAG